MIDWVTCEVPCLHEPLNAGRLMKVSPDGAVEFETVLWSEASGSFEHKVRVRSSGTALDGRASHLRISGNPAKFLQGHNIFGPDDLSALMVAFCRKLFAELGIQPHPTDLEQIALGEYTISRVDITFSYSLRSRSEVLAWLRAVEFKGRSRAGRPSCKGSTVYFQKSSRRWSLKFYSKGQEIEVRQLPDQLKKTPLQKYADNLLRVELTLRSLELRENNIHWAKYFTPAFLQKLHGKYLKRIDMNAQLNLSDELVRELPRYLQATYCLWEKGCDLKNTMKKATFHRHRNELLRYDVDIANQPDNITKLNNVVPLIRVLEAKPEAIPSWAYELKLIAS
jgi:II/X family phage/plasmid replication protein